MSQQLEVASPYVYSEEEKKAKEKRYQEYLKEQKREQLEKQKRLNILKSRNDRILGKSKKFSYILPNEYVTRYTIGQLQYDPVDNSFFKTYPNNNSQILRVSVHLGMIDKLLVPYDEKKDGLAYVLNNIKQNNYYYNVGDIIIKKREKSSNGDTFSSPQLHELSVILSGPYFISGDTKCFFEKYTVKINFNQYVKIRNILYDIEKNKLSLNNAQYILNILKDFPFEYDMKLKQYKYISNYKNDSNLLDENFKIDIYKYGCDEFNAAILVRKFNFNNDLEIILSQLSQQTQPAPPAPSAPLASSAPPEETLGNSFVKNIPPNSSDELYVQPAPSAPLENINPTNLSTKNIGNSSVKNNRRNSSDELYVQPAPSALPANNPLPPSGENATAFLGRTPFNNNNNNPITYNLLNYKGGRSIVRKTRKQRTKKYKKSRKNRK
jgi:hypothetical protein